MSLPGLVTGMPGMRARVSAIHRIVFRGGQWVFDFAGGRIIDGTKARDPGNTPDVDVLRAGLLMGKLATGGKYAPSVIAVTTGAYTSGGTTLAVRPAGAAEIARRVGVSGAATLKAIGPPSAAGTVVATPVTYSAVNTTTGDVTVTSLGVNKVAGTLITAADGSENPVTFIPDGYGLKVTDTDGVSQDTPFPEVPIGGLVDSSQLLPAWPSDTALQAWIVAALKTYGLFAFDHQF